MIGLMFLTWLFYYVQRESRKRLEFVNFISISASLDLN